ncbi:MAG TPA: AraC family transcriptional regulator [Papillibacter sp.]|jgi:AraC-like DNA-binding protein|nr:AraC family transcriptional regulator [Papillibacter sp.]
MRISFDQLVSAIPPELYFKTKATISQDIAVYEPEEFVIGKTISVDDYHFVLFLTTAPVTKVGGVLYPVKKGDMLAIAPWVEICAVPNGPKPHGKYLHIAVRKSFFDAIAAELSRVRGEAFRLKRIHGRYSEQVLDLIGQFQLEYMNYGGAFLQMVRSLATQIVFQLIRDLESSVVQNTENLDNPYISQAISFMREHYQSSITISDICNLIYLSPGHFKRVFKQQTGRTPHQYLMDIRLERSQELLRQTEHSIEDVAKECGFINAGHFAVAFKRRTQLSPSEYRKKFAVRYQTKDMA